MLSGLLVPYYFPYSNGTATVAACNYCRCPFPSYLMLLSHQPHKKYLCRESWSWKRQKREYLRIFSLLWFILAYMLCIYVITVSLTLHLFIFNRIEDSVAFHLQEVYMTILFLVLYELCYSNSNLHFYAFYPVKEDFLFSWKEIKQGWRLEWMYLRDEEPHCRNDARCGGMVMVASPSLVLYLKKRENR